MDIEHLGHDATPVNGAAAPRDVVRATVGESSGELATSNLGAALPPALQQRMRPCTPEEMRAAEIYVQEHNQTAAYREAYGITERKGWHYSVACRVFGRPWVQAYIRELRAAHYQANLIDVDAIVAADLRIIAAAEHSHMLSRYVYRCCRFCHGKGFAYQWTDDLEFCNALVASEDANAVRREQNKRPLPLPDCLGGFGFDADADPNPACPRCEGLGLGRAIIGDTRDMGPAAPLFRGIKQTANGIEVQQHDVDKAKERILRVVGAFGDDATSVARGAAAGAAAGAASGAAAQAIAAAKAAAALTAEQAQRLYLQVING